MIFNLLNILATLSKKVVKVVRDNRIGMKKFTAHVRTAPRLFNILINITTPSIKSWSGHYWIRPDILRHLCSGSFSVIGTSETVQLNKLSEEIIINNKHHDLIELASRWSVLWCTSDNSRLPSPFISELIFFHVMQYLMVGGSVRVDPRQREKLVFSRCQHESRWNSFELCRCFRNFTVTFSRQIWNSWS